MPTRVLLADDHALIRQGLKALLEKQGIQVVTEASDGQEAVFLSPRISRSVVLAYLSKKYVSPDPLSMRERQVLQLVGEGKSTKDIALQLEISVKTAESHRARLMRKLDIHETASLVRYAIRRGLIQA